MDRLSEFVKAGMLNYPSIYPSRLAVLRHTYLVLGNGLDWVDGEDGAVLSDPYAERGSLVMVYDDLDERVAKWGMREGLPGATEFNASIAATVAEQRNERRYREANIDMLACTPDNVTLLSNSHYDNARNIIGYIQTGYLAFGKWPEKVEPSFFVGALEVLDAVIRSTVDDDAARDALKEFRNGLTPTSAPIIPKLAPKSVPQPTIVNKFVLSDKVDPEAVRAILSVLDGASVEEAMAQFSGVADENIQARARVLAVFGGATPEEAMAQFSAAKNTGVAAAREHEQVRAAVASGEFVPTHGISLREINCKVVVLKNGVRIRGFDEYRAAAQYVQNTYGLSDADLFAIYDDYKKDYDNQ